MTPHQLPSTPRPATPPSTLITLRWEPADHWRWLAPTTAVALVAAATLATFGLPPVDIHGPLHYLGVMDPMCGMTRAVRHFARGELAVAIRYNPAVPLLPIAAVLSAARSAYGHICGGWLHWSIRWTHPAVTLPTVIVIVLLWVRQQANADLLGP